MKKTVAIAVGAMAVGCGLQAAPYRFAISADRANCRYALGADLPARADNIARLADAMADVLALHTDYSLWESYLRLDAVEKVKGRNFTKVLFDNASCGYCRSHQYELARHWYAPRAKAFAAQVAAAVKANDRSGKAFVFPDGERARRALMERPLESLKPTLARTEESFRRTMRAVADLLAPAGK